MKKNRKLTELTKRMVDQSFDDEGNLAEEKAEVYVKALKSLPSSMAIFALSSYLKGVKREIGITALEVETAVPLSKSELDQIVKVMKEKYKISHVRNTISLALLGGMRIKIGDIVYDDTIGRKIFQVKEVISG